MAKKKRYRAAIIGCGRIAGFLEDDYLRDHPCTHAGVYRMHEQIELAACCSRNPDTVKQFSSKFRIPRSYTDYREMLSQEELDIVSICTPAPLHYEIVKAAACRKVKAIFCEKALATSLKEADEMIALCEKNGVKLTVNHTRRWMSELRTIRKLVKRGEIGSLQTISGSFGGNLIHTGTHFFDIACFLGGEPEWVIAGLTGVEQEFLDNSGYKYEKREMIKDYGGYGLIGFSNGVIATVCGIGKEYFLFEIDIQGSRGRIRFGNNNVLELWKKRKSTHYAGFKELSRVPFPHPKCRRNGWFLAVDDIIASIEKNTDSISSGKDARMALEIALSMHISHRLGGKKVVLPLTGNKRKLQIVSK